MMPSGLALGPAICGSSRDRALWEGWKQEARARLHSCPALGFRKPPWQVLQKAQARSGGRALSPGTTSGGTTGKSDPTFFPTSPSSSHLLLQSPNGHSPPNGIGSRPDRPAPGSQGSGGRSRASPSSASNTQAQRAFPTRRTWGLPGTTTASLSLTEEEALGQNQRGRRWGDALAAQEDRRGPGQRIVGNSAEVRRKQSASVWTRGRGRG